ncbi:O-antigen ligase family protein [Rhodobacterales bacterium HKCCE3408]|nr:O-antigen ligase family protein [Rhodobacterales bacterium HKCCE3408]
MPARAGEFGRIGLQLSMVESWLAAAAVMAVVVEPVIGSLGALAFLLAGISLLAARPADAASELLRAWPILVLPAFATVSLVWSDVPAASLRYGLQLFVTFAIAIIVARRLSPDRFLRVIFVTLGLVVMLSVAAGNYRSGTGALTGFYASKNAMGGAAAIFTVLSAGLAFGRSSTSAKAGFVLAAGFGLLAVLLAQSMSALLSVAMGISALIAVAILRPLSLRGRIVGTLFCVLIGAYASIQVAAHSDAIAAFVLDATGKDVTLTGRTDLWRIALDRIGERPLLGVGYQAFWVPGNPAAEDLWYAFGIESRSGFHFHNTYLSNAVEIGLIGLGVQVLLLAAIGIQSARLAITGRDGLSPGLFALAVMVLSITPIEVPIFFQFSLHTVMMIVILIYAMDGLNARRS